MEKFECTGGYGSEFEAAGNDAKRSTMDDLGNAYKPSGHPRQHHTSNVSSKMIYPDLYELFVWREDDQPASSDWEACLSKRYYDKLFKEYCVSDLSRYKENKVALRWRVENEVVNGKGQFICGEKRCDESKDLCSWEVNFAYVEDGEKRNALVKLRLCPSCSQKLNFHHRRKQAKHSKRLSYKKRGLEGSRSDTKQKGHKNRVAASVDDGSDEEHQATCSQSDKGDGSHSQCANQPGKSDTPSDGVAEDGRGNIWTKPVELAVEKSREQEFEDYLADLFV